MITFEFVEDLEVMRNKTVCKGEKAFAISLMCTRALNIKKDCVMILYPLGITSCLVDQGVCNSGVHNHCILTTVILGFILYINYCNSGGHNYCILTTVILGFILYINYCNSGVHTVY